MPAKERVAALRELMKKHGIAAYLVPSSDPHQNEYVPDCWQRRRWLSGFTGSAGELVVTMKEAGLWTDARYFIQAARQLKGSGIRLRKAGERGVPKITEYLADTLQEGDALGVDSHVISVDRAKTLEQVLKLVGARIELIEENLVDVLWEDRPSPSEEQIQLLPKKYAGETTASKLQGDEEGEGRSTRPDHIGCSRLAVQHPRARYHIQPGCDLLCRCNPEGRPSLH